jgi:hypothetical protein
MVHFTLQKKKKNSTTAKLVISALTNVCSMCVCRNRKWRAVHHQFFANAQGHSAGPNMLLLLKMRGLNCIDNKLR